MYYSLGLVGSVYPSVSAAVNRRGGETDLRALQTCAYSWPAVDREPLAHEPQKRNGFPKKIMLKQKDRAG
jgi:hypothetical protein